MNPSKPISLFLHLFFLPIYSLYSSFPRQFAPASGLYIFLLLYRYLLHFVSLISLVFFIGTFTCVSSAVDGPVSNWFLNQRLTQRCQSLFFSILPTSLLLCVYYSSSFCFILLFGFDVFLFPLYKILDNFILVYVLDASSI